jgi:TonB-linked SusC/RagA family outer membrane protein
MLVKTLYVATTVFSLLSGFKALAQSPELNLPHGWMKVGDLIDSVQARNIPVSWPAGSLNTSKYIKVHGPANIHAALGLLAEQCNMTCTRLTDSSAFLNPLLQTGIHTTLAVANETGTMLPSATVEDTTIHKFYYTGQDGTTTITSDNKKVTLKVTYIGMDPTTMILTNNTPVTIRLSPSDRSLDEVITTGYGTGTKRNYTGDRSTLNRQQLMPVSNEDLQTILEGRIPGLLVTPTSGIYGSSNNLTIRGQSSIYNNDDPLYVIDKVVFAPGNQSMLNLPSNNSSGSLSPLSLISPSDIENTDVLKDADATAIYGSRGANGVVLITTRRDTATTTHFGLRFSTGASHAPLTLHLMNTPQYLAMRRQAFQNDQLTMSPGTAPDFLVWDTTRYTNWSKWMIGDAARTDNLQATLAGAYKNNTWFLSLSGLHETTVFPDHPTHLRGNSCFDLDHHSHDNKLDLRLSGLIGLDQNNQFIGLDPTYFQLTAPDGPAVKNPDGSLYFAPNPIPYSNPLSFLRQTYQVNAYNYLVDGDASYQLLPWLTLQANLGFNSIGNHEFGETPISAQDPGTQPTGAAYFAHTAYTSKIFEPQAEIKKQYGSLTLSLLTGYSWQQEKANTNSLVAMGYTNDAWLHQQSKAASVFPLPLASTDYAYRAMFSRINLNWNDRYILNLTGRRDGTNRFGPGIKYGNFYAAGAAVIFTRFKAIRDALPFLSFGKLHASIGVTGNDQIGDHHQSSFAPTNIATFDNIPGFFSSNQVLSGTTWETIHKQEIALDLGFIHDRLLLTMARYRHQSKDQLLPQAYPVPGTMDVFRNWPAVLQNSGWEFTLSARLIVSQNFSWTVDANWSLPVNRLVSFPNLNQTPFGNILVVGQSAAVLQGLRFTGVNPTTGIFQFQDLNHDGQITDSDRTVIGHLDPKGFGGITNTFRYKRFHFSFLLDARIITASNYLTALYANNPPGAFLYSNVNAPTELTGRWQRAGQESAFQKVTTSLTTTPASTAISQYTGSSALLTNASFIRLKKMMLSYQTSKKLGQQHHTTLTIFVAGDNLFTITPYKDVDPEIQNAIILPLLRTVEAGISLGL